MKLKAVVFDMDGTIMDSMPFWNSIGAWYLRSLGIEPTEDLGKKFIGMSLEDAEVYLKENYNLPHSVDEIGKGILEQTDIFYENHVELKEGMMEFLLKLKERNIPTAIATVTDKPLALKALKRTGIEDLIGGVVSTQEVGVSKHKPDVFLKACEFTNTKPSETLVIEDTLKSIVTANEAGFKTAAVYDEAAKDSQGEMMAIADFYLDEKLDYNKLLKLF